jgi:hypothetical protein
MPRTLEGRFQSILDNLKTPDNNVILVDSGTGSDSNSGKDGWANALATLDAAIAKCTADNGDKILIAPGHTETWTTTGTKVTFDVDGVEIIGLGHGDTKPTFSFGHTGTTLVMSSNSVKLSNVKFLTAVDSVTTYITVSGNDCELDIETMDVTDKEVITDITNSGDRNKIKITKWGYTAGNANDCVVSCNGCAGAEIEVKAFTKVLTAIVEFVTAASSDVFISGIFYVSGTTDLTKNTVDTITGSTFFVEGYDIGAGAKFSGNTSTPAVDDVGAVSSAIAVVDGLHDVPAQNAVTNAQMRDVIGNKTDTTAGNSAYALLKQIVEDTGTTLDGLLDVIAASDSADNTYMRDVIGRKDDTVAGDSVVSLLKQAIADTGTDIPTSITALATDLGDASARTNLKSILALLGNPDAAGATLWSALVNTNTSYNSRLGTKVTKTAADILDGTQQAMFSITGGRVLVTHIELEVTTAAIDAGANNTQILTNPSVGTDAPMCAVLDVGGDEAGTIYTITGEPVTAMQGGSGGGAPGMTVSGFVVPEGSIDLVSAADGGTGGALIKAELWYMPLDSGASVASS